MPVYHIADLETIRSGANAAMERKTVKGEFMKVGIISKPDAEGPPLHMHTTDEQFTLVLKGKLHVILGDEDFIAQEGDLVHIPRFTEHRSRPVDGPAVLFTVKSPAGTGSFDQDYNKVADAEKAEKKYPGSKS
jgi:quercetin dioxygenase-like cupin family protein